MSSMEAHSSQYLTFEIASESYAVSTSRVRAILEYQPATRVPGSAPFVAGVFNHAGSVTTVVDLAARLGLGTTGVTRRTSIIVIATEFEASELQIGLLVQSVHEVVAVDREQIQPAPDFGTRIRLDYVQGLIRSEQGFRVVLDCDRFLTAEELLEIRDAVSDESEALAVAN